jgi:hypothetical protein
MTRDRARRERPPHLRPGPPDPNASGGHDEVVMPNGTRLMFEAEAVGSRFMPDWTQPPERD